MDKRFAHLSVMAEVAPPLVVTDPNATYVDATFGRGGHSRRILSLLSSQGRLFTFDRDPQAIESSKEIQDSRFTAIHAPFSRMKEELFMRGVEHVAGVFMDIGVSSPQIDDASRGFSFRMDGPLDMRMDRDQSLTAYEIVNNWPREELKSILYEYGEERYAPQIAAAIERVRTDRPIETTLELVDIIRSAMPPSALREKQHPAKRSFQAIRIAVNGELDALPPMLEAAVSHLNAGGRLAVISFHSLEDRIIKKTMQELATGCTCPPNFPVCVCGKTPKIRLVSRKPIVSGDAELAENPRARSAKLRVAEKL